MLQCKQKNQNDYCNLIIVTAFVKEYSFYL